jgi:AraC-like DNA-binding protein
MHSRTHHISSDIRLLSSHDAFYHTEALIGYHLLVWIISGQTIVEQSDTSTAFNAGSRFILPHNRVMRLVNNPADATQFKALTIRLTEKKLKRFYSHLSIHFSFLPVDRIPFDVKPDMLLDDFYKSLISRHDKGEKLDDKATTPKLLELLSILRTNTPEIGNILGSFEAIRKLDIAKFMEGHFKFNLPIEQFSYLTGRSVSAFNRDFRMAFEMPPQRWLTKKRLALARHLLTVTMKRPIDVYREVGFENLSHFSFAFKREFGHSPKDA